MQNIKKSELAYQKRFLISRSFYRRCWSEDSKERLYFLNDKFKMAIYHTDEGWKFADETHSPAVLMAWDEIAARVYTREMF
jgi:hypothetical protein